MYKMLVTLKKYHTPGPPIYSDSLEELFGYIAEGNFLYLGGRIEDGEYIHSGEEREGPEFESGPWHHVEIYADVEKPTPVTIGRRYFRAIGMLVVCALWVLLYDLIAPFFSLPRIAWQNSDSFLWDLWDLVTSAFGISLALLLAVSFALWWGDRRGKKEGTNNTSKAQP